VSVVALRYSVENFWLLDLMYNSILLLLVVFSIFLLKAVLITSIAVFRTC